MNRATRAQNRSKYPGQAAHLPEAPTPAERPAPRPGIDGWENEGGHAAATPRDVTAGPRGPQTPLPPDVLVDGTSSARPSETDASDADELKRLSQELAAIGGRVGNLGRTTETLVLLARTVVLIARSVESLRERVTRLERAAAAVPARA